MHATAGFLQTNLCTKPTLRVTLQTKFQYSSTLKCIVPGKISCKFLHVLCTERALKMSPFLQETCKTCKNCARNFTFLAQFLASSKNLVRNLQGARILHVKYPFSCSVSRILQDIFPWGTSITLLLTL